MKLLFGVSVALGLVVLAAPGMASADTITVANTNDAGAGSLRQAIADVGVGGTIVVPPGSYGVTSGELAIGKSLTISGAGAGSVIISNVGSSRVFHTTGSGNAVTISGVTIRAGHPPAVSGTATGGGILNEAATLTLSDDIIANNMADADAAAPGGNGGIAEGGGVFNDGAGTLVVQHCEIVENKATAVGATGKPGGIAEGAGIMTAGTQTIESSTFAGNTTNAGGGAGANGGISFAGGFFVDASGPTTLSASTFDGNLADASAGLGGTIGGQAHGGGAFMLTNGPAMEAANVTFTGNIARSTAGGITEAGGLSFGSNSPTVTLTNATLSANTAAGGEALGGDAELGGSNTVVENTIVSAGAGAPGFENCVGAPLSAGDNLDSLDQCSFHASGDLINTDPRLGPLADNGGPVATMALEAGSPAIDAVTNSGCPATDARGVLRPAGVACDIGAFEVATPAAATRAAGSVTTGTAVLSGAASNPDLSSASAHFQFGTTTAYGSNTPVTAVGPTVVGSLLAASVSGLAPHTTYHYRLVVTNAVGTSVGSDQTLTTGALIVAPVLSRPTPQISGLKLSRSPFLAAPHGAAVAVVKTGSTVSYNDTLAATATFRVERLSTGRRAGGACVRTTRRNRSRKHCTRRVKVGSFTHADRAGSNHFQFTGRVGGRKLAPGRYLLIARARNSAGAGSAVTAGFAIKAR